MCAKRGAGGLWRAMATLKGEPEGYASSGGGKHCGDRGRRHSMSKEHYFSKWGNTTIISTQKLIMNRHVIYSFTKRRQTSNQSGSRLAVLLMNLPHFRVKCEPHRWNAELRNVLPAQEATLPALIKGNQQLLLEMADDQMGEPGRLGSQKPGEFVGLFERPPCPRFQSICNTINDQDALGWLHDIWSFGDTLVRFTNSFNFFPISISSLKLWAFIAYYVPGTVPWV